MSARNSSRRSSCLIESMESRQLFDAAITMPLPFDPNITASLAVTTQGQTHEQRVDRSSFVYTAPLPTHTMEPTPIVQAPAER